MFLTAQPSAAQIAAFLERSRSLPLSYAPVGLAERPTPGFSRDELTTPVGRGPEVFERASAGLERWTHFNLGWVEVFPRDAPLTEGTTVCVVIRHLGFWSMNGCRVVYPIGARGTDEFGYAYGTLTNHAECGEEVFQVTLDPRSGQVTYTIRAASRPRAALAMLGYPVTRLLQARFRRDSAAALTCAAAG
jgi:uncharacterized protein (UPF0548 family)